MKQEKVFMFFKEKRDYAELTTEDEAFLDLLNGGFVGKKMSPSWKTPTLKWCTDEGEEMCDLPLLMGFIPVFNQKAYKTLSKLIPKNTVEYLPVKADSETYYVVNPLVLYDDVLNLKKSKIKHFPDGRVMDITKYVLLPKPTLSPIFKISQLPTLSFVTKEFVDLVTRNGLTGANFVECEVSENNFWNSLF